MSIAAVFLLFWLATNHAEVRRSSDVQSRPLERNESTAPTTNLDIRCAWLPAPEEADDRKAKPVWLAPRGRVKLSSIVLLRDETLRSDGQWVLLDHRRKQVAVPRDRAVSYFTRSGRSEAPPQRAQDLNPCTILVGAGEVAFLMDVGQQELCRIELRAKPLPGSNEALTEEAARIASSAAILPGGKRVEPDVWIAWLPHRSVRSMDRVDEEPVVFSHASVLTRRLAPGVKTWPLVDALGTEHQIPHGQFIRYLSPNGIASQPPPGHLNTVIFVGSGNIGMWFDPEQEAACRIAVKRAADPKSLGPGRLIQSTDDD